MRERGGDGERGEGESGRGERSPYSLYCSYKNIRLDVRISDRKSACVA